ncbi:hypothetical protein ANCDUO_00176 [Ancylostoma duodenale]|uniref:Reverse transcriptase domain-containing protein n=1 Tax=Ancylostoma duodenale TaxID=51022 RepID=A0A0C2E231_9BILA|nr:hypothetical protein ANCDUO_00176 [Ancylostoma duodenale]
MRKAMKLNESGIGWDNEGRLTDLDCAGDIALLAESDSKLQEATTSLNREAKKIGLRISFEKSKVMKIGTTHAPINIDVGAFRLENVARFTHLGSTVACDGDDEFDGRTRIAKAVAVFQKLQPIWATTSISNNIKIRLYLSIVIPTLSTPVKHGRCLRELSKDKWLSSKIMRTHYVYRVINEEVLRRCGTTNLHVAIAQRRLRLAGHILRMPQHPQGAMSWIPPASKRPRGRPRNTWRRTFANDLKLMDISREQG